MNKKFIVFISIFVLILTIFNYKFFKYYQQAVIKESQRFFKLREKMIYINFLKENNNDIYLLKNICNINNKENFLLISCKNLDINSFKRVERILTKFNFKKFIIKKNVNNITFYGEIIK